MNPNLYLLKSIFITDKENNAKNNRFEGKRVLDARRTNDGPREERNNQRNRDGEVRRGDDDGERRGGGRGRGRGGPGGDRGGRGRGGPGGRGGKREFDRKSGDSRTGIKPEEKRGGSGKGNWGNFEDDVKVFTQVFRFELKDFLTSFSYFRPMVMKPTTPPWRNPSRRVRRLRTRRRPSRRG